MSFIGKAWRGEERCWKVHWIYGGLIGLAWQLALGAAKAGPPSVLLALAIPFLVYFIWFLVSEWRCAFNLEWKFWGYVVRGLVLLAPVGFVAGLLLGGSRIIHDARCRVVLNHPEMRASHAGVYERCTQEGFYGGSSNDGSVPAVPMRQ